MLAIDESSLAELNKAILQSAIESQIVKKADLLKRAKLRSTIRKKVSSNVKIVQQASLSAHVQKWAESDYKISDLSQLVEDINSNDRFKQYRGTIGVRKVLAIDDPAIQPIIDAKLVPRMIEFMQIEDEPRLQLEAAWVLTNVASGTTDQTEIVIKKGAIPQFTKILRSNNSDLREQAIWAVGNISVDSRTNRDIAHKHGALQTLLKIADESRDNLKLIKLATWAISNLCRGRPTPKTDYVRAAIPTLLNLLHSQTDQELLRDAAWALSALTDTTEKLTMNVVMACSSVFPAVVSLLSHSDSSIVLPCLRILGNMCTVDEPKTDAVINCPNFFENIYALLDHTDRSVRRKSIWIMSNITAGTAAQTVKLFQSFPFAAKLISFFENGDDDSIKKEALWVFANALTYAEEEQSLELYQAGILNCFLLMLESNKADILNITLNGIHRVLRVGETLGNKVESKENMVLMEMQEKGALDRLDVLQDHFDDEVHQWVVKILKGFIPFIEIRQRRTDSDDSDDDGSTVSLVDLDEEDQDEDENEND